MTRKIIPGASCIVADRLYFTGLFLNGLFQCDLKTQETHYLGTFTGEGFFDLFRAVVHVGDSLYFVPLRARTLWRFRLDTGTLHKVEGFGSVQSELGYCDAVLQDGRIFMVPFGEARISVYDCRTGETVHIPLGKDFLQEGGRIDLIFSGACAAQDKVYFFGYGDRRSLALDIPAWKLAVAEPLGKADLGTAAGGMLYLTEQDGAFRVLERGPDHVCRELYSASEHFERFLYRKIYSWRDCLWLLPFECRSILKINLGGASVEHIDAYPPEMEFEDNEFNVDCENPYSELHIYHERLLLTSYRSASLLFLDPGSGETEACPLLLPREEFYQCSSTAENAARFAGPAGIVLSKDVCSLPYFLKMIREGSLSDGRQQSAGNTGSKIWDTCKRAWYP